MREVVIAGIGQTPVGEFWEISLRSQAAKAIQAARHDSGDLQPQAMYIGNLLGSTVSHQANLGAVITDNTGLTGIEAYTIEAGEASGAAAFRMGYLAIASGYVDVAVVVGVEKVTDMVGPGLEAAASQVLDSDYEAMQGLTAVTQAALIMRRYLYENKISHDVFATFPLIAHANAVNNPNAMYRKAISLETSQQAEPLNDPLTLFDIAPIADGAAAVILTTPEIANNVPHPLVRVLGSDIAIDTLAVHDRPDLLAFRAAGISLEQACHQAGILPSDVDLFELHDSFSIYAAIALEAGGFAPRGAGWKLAEAGKLNRDGSLPINTMGGAKARGYPLAANGMYQIVEATQQLRGEAGANQIQNAKLALTQSFGGPAATVVTHVLGKMP